MLKREAHEILGIDDDDLKVVSKSMYDLCEFLLRLHDRGELRTDFTSLPMTVPTTRHASSAATASASRPSICSRWFRTCT